jgi:hypothetical protein
MKAFNPSGIVVLIIAFLVAKKGFKLNNLLSVLVAVFIYYFVGEATEGNYGILNPYKKPLDISN